MALPLQRRLERRFRSCNLMAAVSVMVTATVVAVPVGLAAASIVDKVVNGAATAQALVESGDWRAALVTHPRLTSLVNWVDKEFDIPVTVTAASGTLTELASHLAQGSLRQVVEFRVNLYLLYCVPRHRKQALDSTRYLSALSSSQMGRLSGTTKIAGTSTEDRTLWVVLENDLDNQPIWSSPPNFGVFCARPSARHG
jgi:predicted PurR-regulated permease PerM